MAYTLDIKKLVRDVRGPKGAGALSEELTKLNAELNRLSSSVQPHAKAKLSELKAKVTAAQKRWNTLQKEADREVTRTLASVKKIKTHAEKLVRDTLKGKKTTRKKATKKKTTRKKSTAKRA